jgi:hypothetical protein
MVFLLMLEIHFTVRSNSNKQMKAMKLVNVAKKEQYFSSNVKHLGLKVFRLMRIVLSR